MAEKWYFVRVRGQILGPFDLPQLKKQVQRGQVSRFHELSEDKVHWTPASGVPELFPAKQTHSPQAPADPVAITTDDRLPPPARPGREAAPTASADWNYIDERGNLAGPVTAAALAGLLRSGVVRRDTKVWNPSLPSWVSLDSVPEFRLTADAAGGATSPFAVGSLVAGILWLGGLGSAAALVLGLLALRDIGRPQSVLRGRGMAIAGIVLGLLGGVLAFVCAAGLVGYALFGSDRNRNPQEIATEYNDRVYRIATPTGTGSGILLANSRNRGLIATNLHVVSAKLQEDILLKRSLPEIPKGVHVEVKNPSQLNPKRANLAAIHRELDLALLLIEMDNAAPANIKAVRQRNLKAGEPAVALGYPLGVQFNTTPGSISNPRGESGKIWTTCPISPGNSGGPLFIQRGGLLAGLNTETFEKAQNLNGSVPAEEFVNALREGRVDSWIWVQEFRDDVLQLGKSIDLED